MSFYTALQGNILLLVPQLAFCESGYDAGEGLKKTNIWECLEIGYYYCKCRWKLGHVLTLSVISETVKAQLKSDFFPDQRKQPCLAVSVKGVSDNNASYLLRDSTMSPLGLGCPFQRCKCCENEMNAFQYAPVTIMR